MDSHQLVVVMDMDNHKLVVVMDTDNHHLVVVIQLNKLLVKAVLQAVKLNTNAITVTKWDISRKTVQKLLNLNKEPARERAVDVVDTTAFVVEVANKVFTEAHFNQKYFNCLFNGTFIF